MNKISIAIATYNGEKYVEKQMLSLVEQSRPADEVIIVDDCSKDNTSEIVKKFIKERNLSNWKFVVGEENVGYKRNFYNAVSLTTGDIIFLCDQDDIWCKDKLEIMEKVFEKEPSIKALNTSFNFIDGDDKPFSVNQKRGKSNNNLIKKKIRDNSLEKIPLNLICSYNISPGCTMAFTKEVKDIYLNRTKCSIVHDWEINFIAACLDGLYFFNKPLINYRIHTSNAIGLSEITGNGNGENKLSYSVRLKKAEKMWDYIKSFEIYKDLSNAKVMQEQKRFVNRRLSALKNKNLFDVLGLYSQYENYVNSVTTKGRIADIVCLFTK